MGPVRRCLHFVVDSGPVLNPQHVTQASHKPILPIPKPNISSRFLSSVLPGRNQTVADAHFPRRVKGADRPSRDPCRFTLSPGIIADSKCTVEVSLLLTHSPPYFLLV